MEASPTNVRPETMAMKFKEGGVPPSTPTPSSPSTPTDPKVIAMEIKRCKGIPWHQQRFKTQARMSAGGKAYFFAKEKLSRTKKEVIIISDDDTPRSSIGNTIPALRRSTRLLGMKRKNYGEKTPRPMDYGGDSDWEDDRSPGSWGNGDDEDNWPIDDETHEEGRDDRGKGKEVKKEKGDEASNSQSVFGHANCCPRCRADIADLRATLGRALEDLGEVNRSFDHIERLMEDDYKFLISNIRKLFAMVETQGGVAKAHSCTCLKCRSR